jgi:hypothetical protein
MNDRVMRCGNSSVKYAPAQMRPECDNDGLEFFNNTSLQIVRLAIIAHHHGHVTLLRIDKVVQVAHICAGDLAT